MAPIVAKQAAASRAAVARAPRQASSAPKPHFLAQAAIAVAATMLVAGPVFAGDVPEATRAKMCAGNPTSKACLKDSAKR